jgi:hypothetical protein
LIDRKACVPVLRQLASLPHKGHKPCSVSSFQILWHLLQYPAIASPFSLDLLCPENREAFSFGFQYSIVKVLSFVTFIIEQNVLL